MSTFLSTMKSSHSKLLPSFRAGQCLLLFLILLLFAAAPVFAADTHVVIDDVAALDESAVGYEIISVGSRPEAMPRLYGSAAERWTLRWNESGKSFVLKPRHNGLVLIAL